MTPRAAALLAALAAAFAAAPAAAQTPPVIATTLPDWRAPGGTYVSLRGSPWPGKEFTFRGTPAALRAVSRFAGVDVVSLANNHSLVYGRPAFLDTLAYARRYGLRTVGGGATLERARTPSARQRRLARIARKAGAAIVLGARPHVLQPIDRTGILRLGLGTRGVAGSSFRRARINRVQPRL